MTNFNYLKISTTRKIRYLKLHQKNATYIVFLHGFMSDLEGKKPQAFLKFAKKNKLGFLALEYSGHGKSSGKFINGNISKWTRDTTLVIQKVVKKNDIIFIGSSMGAWIALNQFSLIKNKIKGFLGIGSAPEFLDKLMWNKFSDKMKIEIKKKGICAIDTETNSLNIEKAKLVGISICYSENISYYIPINHTTSDGSKKIDNQLEENYVINHINKICKNESILKIGQNIKYDIRILNKYGVTFNSIADTMLISYSIDNGIFKHNLDDLSFNHLNHTTIKYKEVVGTGKNEITFDKVTIDKAINYAAEDSLLTFRLFHHLYPRLIKEKANFVYQNIDLPLVEVLSSIEANGIEVNKKFLTSLSNEFENESKKLEKNIYKLSKKEFNIGSPKQLGEILFVNLKIPGGKKTKTGTYSTDSSTLNNLASDGFEIAQLVLDWRELTKLKSTYTDALFRF